ncbi:MAG: hypothetical protein ACP5N1_04940 [Candidatus Woesearchaeota archaeon]
MVEFNNSYLLGQEYVNNYVRHIEELRKNIENSLLPIVSFLIEKDYSKTHKKLPAGALAGEKKYLQDIGKKYFNRDFDFLVSENENLHIYHVLSKLIHSSKKLCQYDYCELVDFIIDRPEYFTEVVFPDNIITNTALNIREYNKELPTLLNKKDLLKKESSDTTKTHKELSDIVDSDSKIISSNNIITNAMNNTIIATNSINNKFLTPVHLYAQVLNNIKRSIDFESLKLYDYLCELSKNESSVHSNKLLLVYDDLKKLSEQEYTKIYSNIIVYPSNDVLELSREEVFIDELASNIARGMNTKELLALDLRNFLENNEGKELNEGLEKGFYPELRALIYTN